MKFKRKENAIALDDKNGKEVAILEFKIHQDVYYIIRTYVDDSLRGQGVASKLMHALIELLEETGSKASCVCSYSVAWFEKHPEYAKYLK